MISEFLKNRPKGIFSITVLKLSKVIWLGISVGGKIMDSFCVLNAVITIQ